MLQDEKFEITQPFFFFGNTLPGVGICSDRNTVEALVSNHLGTRAGCLRECALGSDHMMKQKRVVV